ncbi:MAG TPA: hypothetical protein VFQ61_17825 [Polyangiaceae bacterium]|nr:hypothetical protein [Polyangiaceae bacterium]
MSSPKYPVARSSYRGHAPRTLSGPQQSQLSDPRQPRRQTDARNAAWQSESVRIATAGLRDTAAPREANVRGPGAATLRSLRTQAGKSSQPGRLAKGSSRGANGAGAGGDHAADDGGVGGTSAPLIRLRYVLGALGAIGMIVWGIPRARAAWDVHSVGSTLADYALCMAGPTGPELIRDDDAEFRRLIRRRLLAAGPEDAPFARCGKLAVELSSKAELAQVHANKAQAFEEYGLNGGRVPLTALGVDAGVLQRRAEQAWPFVRGSSARLVRPSLGAVEAVHPVPPPRPSLGRGLPATRTLPRNTWQTREALFLSVGNGVGQSLYFSSDAGATFRASRSAPQAEAYAEGCVGKDPSHPFMLSIGEDGSLRVGSNSADQGSFSSTAVQGEHELLALACDDSALVVAARREGAQAAQFVLCPQLRSCSPLPLPKTAPFTSLAGSDFDVARSAGVTVLITANRGVVRVVSSRDDGQTWTPQSVAFDAFEHPALRADVTVPTRLLSAGGRLFLYGATSKPNQSYPVLVSDDQGASFRGIGASPEEPGRARVATAPRR